MAEFIYNDVQTVNQGASALLNDAIPCPKGYVLHRPGSGILTLRGIVNNPCGKFARYRVMFDANIAVPEGETPAEIQLALSIGGEIVPTSIAAATPTVADAYWNVSGFAIVNVPAGCCYTIAVENASATDIPASVRNLNVEVSRMA